MLQHGASAKNVTCGTTSNAPEKRNNNKDMQSKRYSYRTDRQHIPQGEPRQAGQCIICQLCEPAMITFFVLPEEFEHEYCFPSASPEAPTLGPMRGELTTTPPNQTASGSRKR